jgi:O-antigen/teichoic acid export membrane protein
VHRTVPALVILAGASIAVVAAPAYALAPVVFGRAFSGASLPLALLLVGLIAYLECCLLGSVLTAYDRTADSARAIIAAAALNVIADVIALGLFGAGSWAPAVATVTAFVLMAAGYARAVSACTDVAARLTLAAYPAPLLALGALVLAPEHWRVWAGLAVGVSAAAITLVVAWRAGVVEGDLLARLTLSRRTTGASESPDAI